jgi:two-component sensor histidine kinase
MLLYPAGAEVVSQRTSQLRSAARKINTPLQWYKCSLVPSRALCAAREIFWYTDLVDDDQMLPENWTRLTLTEEKIDEPSRVRAAFHLESDWGNVSFLERPFHPTTLLSVARTALRSRRRQYEAREVLKRYELLARELQHRTKNLLSVILSIAGASLREGGEGNEVFIGRLHSLAKAQDIIFA